MPVYLYGVPGRIGGAATKIRHLLSLLHQNLEMIVVLPKASWRKDKHLIRFLKELAIPHRLVCELPRHASGVVLAICEPQFFSSGVAQRLKEKGLRIVWMNAMMWAFKGEPEAAQSGVIDRVLWVSEFEAQAEAFMDIYKDVPGIVIDNYVDPKDFPWAERRNSTFTIGRLSRPDPVKYPLNFPHFYEALGLRDVRYRVMAWSNELSLQYRWHQFGPEWDLIAPNKIGACEFLQSLDIFVYPLSHRVKESWGRSVVEAMLTGCPPLVPAGHHFQNLMVSGESGYICGPYEEWQAAVDELFNSYSHRQKMSRFCSEYARETHCQTEIHRERWLNALSFVNA